MRAVVLALIVTTACHTTVRIRTTPAGTVVEEPGRCDSEDVGPNERCQERDRYNENATAILIAATFAAMVGAGLAVGYLDNNCSWC